MCVGRCCHRDVVKRALPEPFYKVRELQPYRFFDVAGRHQGAAGSKSLFNHVIALSLDCLLAVCGV